MTKTNETLLADYWVQVEDLKEGDTIAFDVHASSRDEAERHARSRIASERDLDVTERDSRLRVTVTFEQADFWARGKKRQGDVIGKLKNRTPVIGYRWPSKPDEPLFFRHTNSYEQEGAKSARTLSDRELATATIVDPDWRRDRNAKLFRLIASLEDSAQRIAMKANAWEPIIAAIVKADGRQCSAPDPRRVKVGDGIRITDDRKAIFRLKRDADGKPVVRTTRTKRDVERIMGERSDGPDFVIERMDEDGRWSDWDQSFPAIAHDRALADYLERVAKSLKTAAAKNPTID